MSSDPIPGDQAGDDRVAQPPSTVHWRELKVLLVDDHPAYCLLMGAMFERLGLAFEVCAHGQAALAFLDVTCVDLIFSDCQMPVMDGFAMTRELRRREQRAGTQGVPVIAFTGKLGAHEIQQCQAAGMDAWLDKPVTFQQLRQVLGDWLPGPRMSEAVQPMVAVEGRWPSRARLGQLFGCPEALPGILASLVYEAEIDLHALAQAADGLHAQATVEHLHRLIGSVAFFGATPLERRGQLLIEAINRDGVAMHLPRLLALRSDLIGYLNYLSALGNG
ncbi:response regulator [Pseudomonas simiae]|uniref:response regulator n=1 Tax=Pseudomonas simiae TaxID=321846 RepID=UPI0018E62E58|nr:response regulator [Pseudomonas simiae]MBI6611670.1 response regulator [Pseudomonas simiae]